MKQLKYFFTIFATIVFMSILGCASTTKSEGTGEYVDDSVITTKVKAAIFNVLALSSNVRFLPNRNVRR